MIIGKDKERVRLLEIQAKLTYELIETLRNDMETICDAVNASDDKELRDEVVWRLCTDIGKCSGHLDYFK